MNPGEIQDLVDLLIEIGGSLAEAGFELATRRATFLGYANFIWVIILGILGFVFVKVAVAQHRKSKEERYGDGELWMAFASAGAFLSIVPLPFLIHTAIDYIINPQWAAVRMLMRLITRGD